MFDNFRRDSQDYARFVQTDGQHYKNEIAEGSKGPGQGRGLAAMLGLGCPNPNYNKDAFTMMGIRPHESKKENFSYLQ